jgi:nitrate/nitrite transport system ATP-binding protein
MNTPVIHISGVSKNYSALRPLRVQELTVEKGERVAISGFDAAGAELMVNLITGASLPDHGTIRVFGRATSEIADGEAWIASLDRFGIVSPRAVMLEGSSLQSNLALPFTLDIDPVAPSVLPRVVALARECGIAREDLPKQVGELPAHVRVRAHLARAVALNPELLLIEHPTVDVAEAEKIGLAQDVAHVVHGRGATALVMTTDVEFAGAVAHRSLALQPATGAMVPWKPKRGWFR